MHGAVSLGQALSYTELRPRGQADMRPNRLTVLSTLVPDFIRHFFNVVRRARLPTHPAQLPSCQPPAPAAWPAQPEALLQAAAPSAADGAAFGLAEPAEPTGHDGCTRRQGGAPDGAGRRT